MRGVGTGVRFDERFESRDAVSRELECKWVEFRITNVAQKFKKRKLTKNRHLRPQIQKDLCFASSWNGKT